MRVSMLFHCLQASAAVGQRTTEARQLRLLSGAKAQAVSKRLLLLRLQGVSSVL